MIVYDICRSFLLIIHSHRPEAILMSWLLTLGNCYMLHGSNVLVLFSIGSLIMGYIFSHWDRLPVIVVYTE